MKVTITQENLARALSYVSKAISSNPSIPVLANVLIEVTDSQIKLSATDLEVGICTVIGGDVKNDGKVTVDARTLTDFVNSLASGTLNLELLEKVLIVKNKTNSADFNIIGADEFPPLPAAKGKATLKVNAKLFAKAIGQVAVSAASDDSRPVLTGILFEATQRKLSMVGVDGFRLTKKIIEIQRNETEDIKQIVPAKALSEFARIVTDIAEEKDNVEMYLLSGKNQLQCKIKDVEFTTRLIEGEFPDYNQIIPTEKKFSFAVDKIALAQTIKIVSIFARSAVGNKASFETNSAKNTLKLSAQVADVGENESQVDIHNVEGENLKTAFNTKFLSDMINTIESEDITFESNGPTAPGVFKDKDDKDFLNIVMPMRLD